MTVSMPIIVSINVSMIISLSLSLGLNMMNNCLKQNVFVQAFVCEQQHHQHHLRHQQHNSVLDDWQGETNTSIQKRHRPQRKASSHVPVSASVSTTATKEYLQIQTILKSSSSNQQIQEWFVTVGASYNENHQQHVNRDNNNDNHHHSVIQQPQLHLHPQEQIQIIKELAKRMAFDQIIYFFKHFSDHSIHVYTTVISSLSKSKQYKHSHQALQLMEQMNNRGIRPNRYTFTALFQHIHGPVEARRFLQYLQQQQIQQKQAQSQSQSHYRNELNTIQVYNAAIHACTRKQQQRPPLHAINPQSNTFPLEDGTTITSMGDDDHITHSNNSDNCAWQTALYFYRTMRTTLGITPNQSTYSSLLLTCAQAKQIKIAMSILDNMAIPPNPIVYGAALTVCAKVGAYPQAATILQKMQQQQQQTSDTATTTTTTTAHITTRHVSAYLAALAKGALDQPCLQILNALKHKQPFPLLTMEDNDESHFTTHDDSEKFQKDTNQQPPSIVWLPPVPIDLVLVNTVIYACAQAANDKDALRLLTELKNGEYSMIPEVTAATIAASTAASVIHRPNYKHKMNSNRRHLEFHRPLISTTTTGTTSSGGIVNLRPDEITYNTVISACTNATQVKTLIKEMRLSRRHREGQIPPTAKTYTLAIAACKYDFDTAMFLLQDCKHDGIVPNVFMYSAAIWIAERFGKVDDALRLLQQMKEANCEPNDVSYGGVITTLAAHGRARDAIQLYAEMKTKGITTNGKIFGRLAEAINRATALDKNIEELACLESVFKLMNDSDFNVKVAGSILEPLILKYGMSDRFNDALAVFDKIRGPTDGPCLRAILSACALARDRWDVALDLLHSSDIVGGARGPARVDMRAIGFAMLACSKSGQWEEAMNLLELYGRRSIQTVASNADDGDDDGGGEEVDGDDDVIVSHVPRSAINSLITACGRGGRPDLALKLLNDMKSKYGVEPNEISYRSAAIACNQAQHENRRRRQEQGLDPQSSSTTTPTTTLQWWECSLSLLRRMKEEGLQPDAQTYSSVISACEAAGQWQRALGVLRDGPVELNLYCFNAAISACEKGGAWVEALELYYQMMERGGVVKPNFVTLSSLLIALDRAGQKELAQDLYEQGLATNIVRRPWTRTRAAATARETIMTASPPGGAAGKADWVRVLDFHNYSSAMARTAIRSVIESLINDGKPAHDVNKDLIVVVGKGKGSRVDPVLGQAVVELLQNNYGIRCVVDPYNSGRIVVKAADLQLFTNAKNAWRQDSNP